MTEWRALVAIDLVLALYYRRVYCGITGTFFRHSRYHCGLEAISHSTRSHFPCLAACPQAAARRGFVPRIIDGCLDVLQRIHKHFRGLERIRQHGRACPITAMFYCLSGLSRDRCRFQNVQVAFCDTRSRCRRVWNSDAASLDRTHRVTRSENRHENRAFHTSNSRIISRRQSPNTAGCFFHQEFRSEKREQFPAILAKITRAYARDSRSAVMFSAAPVSAL